MVRDWMKYTGCLLLLVAGCALVFVGTVEYDLSAREKAATERRLADASDATEVHRRDRISSECGWLMAGSVAAGVLGGLLIVGMGVLMTRRRSATRATGRVAVAVSVLALGCSLLLVRNYRQHRARIESRDRPGPTRYPDSEAVPVPKEPPKGDTGFRGPGWKLQDITSMSQKKGGAE